MAQLTAFAKLNDGTSVIETLPSWLPFFKQFIVEVEAPIGTPKVLGSRLMPRILFESAEGRARVVTHLLSQT
ncbi:hypothetical protein C8F04DRAFT_1402474 [Mycena alexandri]|uniref:Uncharacterized protein n=1 Tax=Mycena alexandri TaxID=1745969 RepID=A0AAD6S7D3_9AGAR|nr:hypothetical protein C8F04DRAFT_1402474 [Mycena alexandri]